MSVEFTKNFERHRIVDPRLCKPGSFRTHDIGKPGGTKRIACVNRSTGRWITQSLLIGRGEPEPMKRKLRKSASALMARMKRRRRTLHV